MKRPLDALKAYLVASVVISTGIPAMAETSQAQTISLPGYTDAQAQAAVAPLIPTPLGSVPPSPTPSGVVGSGNVFIPGNAAPPTLCRRTTVTTDGTGAFSVTWATPLVSSSPWGGVEPIWNATTMPPICWMKTDTATGITGQCVNTQTTALNLGIVTAGLTLNPFGAGSSALTVKVHACEPTQ